MAKDLASQSELQLLIEAFSFAAHKHRDQRRKDAEASPYINHPIQLARVLALEGNITDEQTIAAAMRCTMRARINMLIGRSLKIDN